jgi:hypothetical protein
MRKRSATVLLDDYIEGRLPEVCAVTGVSTDDQVRLRTNVARINWLWYLALFFGPVGWIVLGVVLFRTRDPLEGWLPYLHEEVLRRRSRRRAIIVGAGGVVGVSLVLYLALGAPVLLWLCAVAVVGCVLALMVMSTREPRIRLDPSRQWLTISRCHPRFVEAVEHMFLPTIDSQI